ncbi:MAG TPA: hypothetical protein VNQ79_15735 [Blastocatellia bacterium]|nr:hypothetical protein [Blastocatellia bacterium]
MTETGTQTTNRTEEIRRLQNCINDLVSLLALPAIWTGREPSEIVTILLDALSGLLRLEFIYARLEDSGAPFEAVRAAGQQADLQPAEIGRRLAGWLDPGADASSRLVPDPFGNGELTIASCRLGLEKGAGIIVAVSGLKREQESLWSARGDRVFPTRPIPCS